MSPRHDAAVRVPPPRRDREHHPSFSAALLDAIYHSLDGDACAPADDLRRANVSPDERPQPPHPCGRHRSTASSPSGSTSRSPRSQKPPRPCRVRPHPQPPSLLLPPPTPLLPGDGKDHKRTRKKKKKRRARSAPFACLLNALLCNRKPPVNSTSVDATATRAMALPPAIKAEPASARSILSSRASRRESAATAPGGFMTPGRRAVRFSPAVEIVGDEEHDRGARTAIRLRDVSGSGAEVVAAPRESAAEAERRVEELLRALGAAEERERAKESSESSSELFELDSLPPTLVGGIEIPRTVGGIEIPRTRDAGLAPPRPRVLLDEMVV